MNKFSTPCILLIGGMALMVLCTSVQALEDCTSALRQGKTVQAIALAQAVLQNTPQDTSAYLCLGRAQMIEKHYAVALTTFQQAEKTAKSLTDKALSSIFIGHAYLALMQYESAKVAYRASMAYAEQEGKLYLVRANQIFLGDVALAQGQAQEALQAYQQASGHDGNDDERLESASKQAETYAQLAQFEQAIAYQLKSYVLQRQLGGDYVTAGISLATYYYQAKHYAQARDFLQMLQAHIPAHESSDWVEVAYYLAKLEQAMGNSTQAITYLKQAKIAATHSQNQLWLQKIQLLWQEFGLQSRE